MWLPECSRSPQISVPLHKLLPRAAMACLFPPRSSWKRLVRRGSGGSPLETVSDVPEHMSFRTRLCFVRYPFIPYTAPGSDFVPDTRASLLLQYCDGQVLFTVSPGPSSRYPFNADNTEQRGPHVHCKPEWCCHTIQCRLETQS